MDGETYVTPDHVRRVAPDVINHRVMLAPEAMLENPSPGAHVIEIIGGVAVPR